jgi:uncharacterized YccA/Bax inhibitor family protein
MSIEASPIQNVVRPPSNNKKEDVVVQAIEKTITPEVSRLLISAVGTVSALAWVEFIKSLFESGNIFHRFKKKGPLVVAIVTTLIAIAVTNILRDKARPASLPEKGSDII